MNRRMASSNYYVEECLAKHLLALCSHVKYCQLAFCALYLVKQGITLDQGVLEEINQHLKIKVFHIVNE